MLKKIWNWLCGTEAEAEFTVDGTKYRAEIVKEGIWECVRVKRISGPWFCRGTIRETLLCVEKTMATLNGMTGTEENFLAIVLESCVNEAIAAKEMAEAKAAVRARQVNFLKKKT